MALSDTISVSSHLPGQMTTKTHTTISHTCCQHRWLLPYYYPHYRIFPAIRRGFRPSRMTSNNLISPMKFCYNTNSTLPKQCQSSRSVLEDGSRTFGLFWKEKNPSYNRRNTVVGCPGSTLSYTAGLSGPQFEYLQLYVSERQTER